MSGMRSVRFVVPLALFAIALASCSGGQSNSSPPPIAQPPADPAQASTQSAAMGRRTPGIIQLRSYRVDSQKVFVAGISSGGFFAVQMHVAHSATFKGAAVYAGGVYYCAQDSVVIALTACGGEGLYAPELTQSEAYLDTQSQLGNIDAESNLAGESVYLWSGTQDTVVNQKSMNDL